MLPGLGREAAAFFSNSLGGFPEEGLWGWNDEAMTSSRLGSYFYTRKYD